MTFTCHIFADPFSVNTVINAIIISTFRDRPVLMRTEVLYVAKHICIEQLSYITNIVFVTVHKKDQSSLGVSLFCVPHC